MEFQVYENFWWATPVWECQVKHIDNFSILEYCLENYKNKPGVIRSNKGGWHSGEDIITPIPPSLDLLFDNIVQFSKEQTLPHIGVKNLQLGNWWVNVNRPHDYNTPHNHQFSILSGVYYVSIPNNNTGNLILHREDNMEYFLTSRVKKDNTYCNALDISLTPQESSFYLFPSWVRHSVEKNESNQNRISIAFNLISI